MLSVAHLPLIDNIGMPLEEFLGWTIVGTLGHPQLVALELKILFSVMKLLFDSAAHHEPEIGCDRNIPAIEKSVKIRPEQKAVINPVSTTFADRAYVRRLEHGKNLFTGHSATPLVGIGHHDTEGPLPQID